jgi:hypothetical protein
MPFTLANAEDNADNSASSDESKIDTNSTQLIDNDGNIVCTVNADKSSCDAKDGGTIFLDSTTNTVTIENLSAGNDILFMPTGQVNLAFYGNNSLKELNAKATTYLSLLGNDTANLNINSISLEQGASTNGAILTDGNLKFAGGNYNIQSKNTAIFAKGAILIEGALKLVATTSEQYAINAHSLAVNLENGGDLQLFGGINTGLVPTDSEICLSRDTALDKSALTPNTSPDDITTGTCIPSLEPASKTDSIHIFYREEIINSFSADIPLDLIIIIAAGIIIATIIIVLVVKKRRKPSLLIPFVKQNDEYSKNLANFIYENGRDFEHIFADSSWKIAIPGTRLVQINGNLAYAFRDAIIAEKVRKIRVYPEADNLKTSEDINILETIEGVKFTIK